MKFQQIRKGGNKRTDNIKRNTKTLEHVTWNKSLANVHSINIQLFQLQVAHINMTFFGCVLADRKNLVCGYRKAYDVPACILQVISGTSEGDFYFENKTNKTERKVIKATENENVFQHVDKKRATMPTKNITKVNENKNSFQLENVLTCKRVHIQAQRRARSD